MNEVITSAGKDIINQVYDAVCWLTIEDYTAIHLAARASGLIISPTGTRQV